MKTNWKAYGVAGAAKIVNILTREITSGMRLLGARNVRELVPEMVGVIILVSLLNR
jgi:isopentenyl diphosphate isomerase/L-lactate dehydrogenase-like FMN-dependent dehydrogenase